MTEVALRRYESLQETAQRTGLSLRTVRRHVASGLFRVHRIDHLTCLDPVQVDNALDWFQGAQRG